MESLPRRDMDWIRNIQWDRLSSAIQDGDITPWTNLWRQASFFYAHDEHFRAQAMALLAGLTFVGMFLLAWIAAFIRDKFSEIAPPMPTKERKLLAVLEAVKLIDESRDCLRRISETLKVFMFKKKPQLSETKP